MQKLFNYCIEKMENYMSQEAELRLKFQYVQPSMDKIYCIESPCKLLHKKFQKSYTIFNQFSATNLLRI